MFGTSTKRTVGFLLWALLMARTGGAQPYGSIVGTVVSPTGDPLPGVVVSVSNQQGVSELRVTGARGEFEFADLPVGRYQLVAALPSYEDLVRDDVNVGGGEEVRLALALELRRISESVTIEEVARATESNDPKTTDVFRVEKLDLLPLATDRFQESFPLVPGVVRDPEGRISFNGARPSQSILLVNGANVTDPLTGEFAIELPLRAIEAVEVNRIPYSAEYGRVTAAVARIETRGGTDEWDLDTGNLLPKFNFRDGTIQGLKSWVPQFGVSGPLKKGKLWFSQGFTYRFARSRVYDVDFGEDERVLEGFDTFTQLDARLADRHHLTTTFSYFPQETDNLGINALTPAEATPDFDSWGWNAAISERSIFSDNTLVETIVAMKSFDVALRPKERIGATLTPEGLRENYFNELNRESTRFEVTSACTHSVPGFFGEHVLKIGGGVANTRFQGSDQSLPIDIVSADGVRLRHIDFTGEGRIDGSNVQASAFVQDQWRPNERLGFDVGIRYDYDRLVREHQLAPRFSTAIALDGEGRTILKGGVGIFYDHVFLHVDAFERFQNRVETSFGPDGQPVGPPVVFEHRVTDEDIELPRSVSWNVEVNRVVADGAELRVNYRERRGSKELIVDRLEQGSKGTFLLSSAGESLTRELDVTLRVAKGEERELFFSYVKSRTTGDLNDFGTLYQNLRSPLVLENERSPFGLDVPNRFLFWGIWRLPKDFIVTPGLEWRTGFPYTAFDESYAPVGGRNRGGRFPSFLSADIRVTKGIEIMGRRARVGFQIFNLGSHFNPRDVVSNLGSARFGQFLNGVDMKFSLRFRLLF